MKPTPQCMLFGTPSTDPFDHSVADIWRNTLEKHSLNIPAIHCIACGGPLLPENRFIHQDHFGTKGRDKRTETLLGKKDMRTEYDFTKATRNPYAKRLKKTVTIRLDPNIIDYFKSMSGETDIPYQNLINLYLLDCAKAGRKLSLAWKT